MSRRQARRKRDFIRRRHEARDEDRQRRPATMSPGRRRRPAKSRSQPEQCPRRRPATGAVSIDAAASCHAPRV